MTSPTPQPVLCNLCQSDDSKLIAIQKGYSYVRCRKCGLVYLHSRPSEDELIRLYGEYHQREEKEPSDWERLMEKDYRFISNLLNQTFPGKGNLLDIGCGYGFFLKKMVSSGWSAQGIDPSPTTVKYARENRLMVQQLTLDKADFPRESFEVITAFYVLEHLLDPLSSLQKIHTFLKPGGMLVLKIPHTTPIVQLLSLFHIKNNLYDPPFHLYDYSPKTSRQFLLQSDFVNIRILPGKATRPIPLSERMISILSSQTADLLFKLTLGKLLIPGISKIILAEKKK